MTTTSVAVLLFIMCLMFVNFLIWSSSASGNKTERNSYETRRAANSTQLEHSLAEIRQELDDGWKYLKRIDAKLDDNQFLNMKAESIKQVPLRKRTLGQIFRNNQFEALYGSLTAEVLCPEKIRVGEMGDGGKWTCNPWKVPQDSVMLSFGLNNQVDFELKWQLMLSNRSVIYGFDSDDQKKSTKETLAGIRGNTIKALIAPESSPEKGKFTMIDLANKFNISQVEILKIDIEGAEKTCLIPFLRKFTICQIYMELHGGSQEHLKLLTRIAHLNYRLFSYEVNGFSMKACEYSFIHESCVEKYGGKRIANYLDLSI